MEMWHGDSAQESKNNDEEKIKMEKCNMKGAFRRRGENNNKFVGSKISFFLSSR
jgi:hypothetical protein